ncbi:hypothetical protein CPT_Marzo_244 [Stenotrophomonas phage Marzo]|nr:hypothetical protein CPT_Marzo_244 [Stenotrophomonas phage Marzo]
MKIIAKDQQQADTLVKAFNLSAADLENTLVQNGLEIELDDLDLDIMIDGLYYAGYASEVIEVLLEALGSYDHNSILVL